MKSLHLVYTTWYLYVAELFLLLGKEHTFLIKHGLVMQVIRFLFFLRITYIAIFLFLYCEGVLITAQLTMNEAGLSADSKV